MTKRPLSGPDRALWDAVQRSARPLRGRRVPATPVAPAQESGEIPAPPRPRPARTAERRTASELVHGSSPGVDRRLAERLRRGQLPIEARIDLHGMTQARAHGALTAFLADAAAAGKRCVLVITGKGRSSAGAENGPAGVLREMVPRWLNQPPNRALLLAFVHARPQDGGTGALYVLLKRQRKG